MGTRVPTIYVLNKKKEKYQSFISENFQFLVVKFSIYLNRQVFVMNVSNSKGPEHKLHQSEVCDVLRPPQRT